MRLRVVVCFMLSIFLVESPLSSQQASPAASASPQRDADAVAVVEQAVAALGGQASLGSIIDSVSTGDIVTSGVDSSQTSTFTWKTMGGEFRYEVQTQSGSSLIYVSGHGNPANSVGGVISGLPQYMALATPAFHVPGMILWSELQDPQYSVTYSGLSHLPNGQLAVHVRVISGLQNANSAVTQQDWYVDQSTGLPIRVEYCLPSDQSTDCDPAAIEYSDYHSVSGISVPFTLRFSLSDGSTNLATVNSTSFNVGLIAGDFDLFSRSAQ